MVFAMFGSYAVIVGWRDAGWRVVVFAVLALFAVRVVAVLVALIRSDLPARSRVFIGWFGPRGIGTLVLGVLIINRGEIEQELLITQVVAVTVTLSLVLHSLTAWPGIRCWERGPSSHDDALDMSHGAWGRTSPVSSSDLRLANTAGQPPEIAW